jgi:hypothetical protein
MKWSDFTRFHLRLADPITVDWGTDAGLGAAAAAFPVPLSDQAKSPTKITARLSVFRHLCLGVLTIACMQSLGLLQTATAQSFPPGTGRYWKRNSTPPPPKISTTPIRSVEEIAAIRQKFDQASQTAEKSSALADTSAKDLANASTQSAQLQAHADSMAQELAVKTQALSDALKVATTANKTVEDLSRPLTGVSGRAARPNFTSAMHEQLNSALLEQTKANSAVTDAQSQVDQANAVSKSAQADSYAASQHLAELAATLVKVRAAAIENQAAANEAKNNLDEALAPPAIHASKGGFGFTQPIKVTASGSAPANSIHKSGSKDATDDFKVENDCSAARAGATCQIVVAFHPSGSDTREEVELRYGEKASVIITGQVDPDTDTAPIPRQHFFPLNRPPAVPDGLDGLGQKLEADFGIMLDMTNAFWSQEKSFSYLNQTQFFYNTGSSSSTLKADVASMVFPGGTQLSLATNIPVGTSNSTPKSTAQQALSIRPGSTAASTPSMTSAQAAQATQNLVDGGNLLLRASWPLYWYAPKYMNFEASGLVVAREGLDIPNFNGANTVATDPINHFNISNEWYLQFDALPAKQGGDSQGSIFLDAKYGFDYVSTAFANQAGFVHNWNKGILSQITGGLVFSGKLNIIASRNFGPDQTWIDTSSGAAVTENNFRSWSVGVKYATNQSK